MQAVPHWRRNLFAVSAATFMGFTGFTLVMPFLPLYFRQLGVTDVGEVALWSGLSLGVTPALTALLAPLWGRLADRFGRKIMVERSLLSFVVVMTATAFVTEAWHVFALRAVQGFFAGYGSLALAMAAESAPAGRMAGAIGTVQTAQRLGPALGPLIGGVVAQLVGIRNAFFVTAAIFAVGFVIVLVLYHEPARARTAPGTAPAPRLTFRDVARLEGFVLLMLVIFAVQFVDRSFGPVLTLFLEESGMAVERVPLAAGALFSVAAGAGAAGNLVTQPLLRLAGPRVIISAAALGAGVATGGFVLISNPWLLAAVCLGLGLSVGVAMTTAYATGGGRVPAESRATGFAYLTSASLAGLALSPIVSGFIATWSIRAVFLVDAVGLVGVAALARARMRGDHPSAGP